MVSFRNGLEVLWSILKKKQKPPSSWIKRKPRSKPSGPTIIKNDMQQPLYALIIGINDYEHPTLTKLSGAVTDADAMNLYLESDLKVPPKQIINLRNKQATRKAIIGAFERLRDNPNIKPQDPILIYYAGHGGEVPTVGPDKTQTLIPVDYYPEKTPPIPDRTVAALIDGIARKHGNNITVIFDCCHSGSGTRGGNASGEVVRAANLMPNDITDSLDKAIIQSSGGTRSISQAKGFAQKGINSHILLAACSADELAREDRYDNRSTGRFTAALLEMLRSVSLDQITYDDVLTRIPRIEGQNPQCEGANKNRIIFDARVRPPTLHSYEVKIEVKGKNRIYTLEGGRAHGITDGAEFTLYETEDDFAQSRRLCVTVARESKIEPFTTTLEPVISPRAALEGSVIAIQSKAGALEDLKLHIPTVGKEYLPVFEAVAREMEEATTKPCRIKLVDRDQAKLEVVAEGNRIAFNPLDKVAVGCGFTRLPDTVEPTAENLHTVLRAAAHYHYHLNVNQENNQIKNKIKIEFFRLKEVPNDDLDEIVYLPDGDSLYDDQKATGIDYEVTEGAKYGMKITNTTPWDLQFACFFFDHADFSITSLSEDNYQAEYKKDYSLKRDSAIEIGYGSLGIPPFESDVPEDYDLTIGFLKFYFTTASLKLSHIPQVSPFSLLETRGMKPKPNREGGQTWGTVLIPVIQRKASGA